MGRIVFGVLVFVICLVPVQAQVPPALVIRDVVIVDCTGRHPRSHMSVLVSGGYIQAIRAPSDLKSPANAETLDGRGKYLIPGLWNMHAHLGSYEDGKAALVAYLAQGVTRIRDMGSPLEDILRLRRETSEGTTLGPQLVVAGPILQGPLPFQMPLFVSVADAVGARDAVRTLKAKGVDFIKVQDAIPHDLYVAVAEEARQNHIPFAGHIPPTVLPEEASDLGQRSVEHLGGRFWGVLIGSSRKEAELHADEVRMYREALAALERKDTPPSTNMRAAFVREVVESYDPQRAASLISRFVRNHTWHCPTLVALHTLWNDPDARYSAEDLRLAKLLIARQTRLVAMMQKAGVGLLAGTDLSPTAKEGTLHDELAALVDAGLSPLQALQAATRNPAQFMGALSSSGTIEVGKTADLVLLDANPLENIHNTRRVSAVILRGNLVSQHTASSGSLNRPARRVNNQ